VTRSHYETLGVAEGADPEVVRRAYLDLARQLHPDRWVGAGADERHGAERRMQELNEAWRVLGNPGRRLAYDSGRRGRAATTTATAAATADGQATFTSGDLFGDVDPGPPDLVGRLVRALPWGLVLLALGAIFVFTAYATGDSSSPSCVRPDGGAAVDVGCDAPGARRIELRVGDASQCPEGTEPFQPAGAEQALCLAT
jgi:curved DNA-binding protein CbpA